MEDGLERNASILNEEEKQRNALVEDALYIHMPLGENVEKCLMTFDLKTLDYVEKEKKNIVYIFKKDPIGVYRYYNKITH